MVLSSLMVFPVSSSKFSRVALVSMYCIVVKFQISNYSTFRDMNYFLVWFLVKSRLLQTESDAYDRANLHRWAQKAPPSGRDLNTVNGMTRHIVLRSNFQQSLIKNTAHSKKAKSHSPSYYMNKAKKPEMENKHNTGIISSSYLSISVYTKADLQYLTIIE